MRLHSIQLYSLILASYVSAFIDRTATYEDFGTLNDTTSYNIPAISTYDNLTYISWILSTDAENPVNSHSPHNRISISATSQRIYSAPAFVVAAPYKSFSLLEFWFGCDFDSLILNAPASSNCTIQVDGHYEVAGVSIPGGSVNFTYVSPYGLKASTMPVAMTHAVLPLVGFQGVQSVNVTLFSEAPHEDTFSQFNDDILFVDNLHYRLFP
ncbi:hypothetical protein BDR22DRAFT_976753 [Usnea florida]